MQRAAREKADQLKELNQLIDNKLLEQEKWKTVHNLGNIKCDICVNVCKYFKLYGLDNVHSFTNLQRFY